MTRVFYMVGKNGYETRCNTYEGALSLAGDELEVRTCYEEIKEARPTIKGQRKTLVDMFGFVKPGILN